MARVLPESYIIGDGFRVWPYAKPRYEYGFVQYCAKGLIKKITAEFGPVVIRVSNITEFRDDHDVFLVMEVSDL